MLGRKAINPLIKALLNPNKKVQSCAAMALIRIGSEVIEPLETMYSNDTELNWTINFIISQIKGTEDFIIKNKRLKSIAG